MSEIRVNGERRSIAPDATVDDVVAGVTANAIGCAVAVNDAVVPRAAWATRTLEPGDRVEILTAVQGG
jgi:sulfur carrier protein